MENSKETSDDDPFTDVHNDSDDIGFHLKEGISLSDVKKEGSTFELDLERNLSDLNFDDDKQYFDKDEILNNLNYDLTGGDSEEGESDNSTDEKEPFQKLRTKMQPLNDDGTVMKRIKQHGFGTLPPKKAEVTIHYNAYLEYSDEPFDSSRLRNRPIKFFLEDGRVIMGLDIGVASMREKEVAEFMIQPEYAFGSMGCPPRIPANAIVLYVVELIHFVEAAATVEFSEMNPEDRENAPFSKVLEVCKAENNAANELFNMKQYNRALHRYNKGLQLLQKARLANEEEEKDQKKLLVKLFCNVTMCHLNLNAPDRAIPTALSALKIDPNNIKAMFRCGKAYRLNGNFPDAKRFLQQAARKEPHNQEIAIEITELKKDIEKFYQIEKDFCSKIFPTEKTTSTPVPVKLNVSQKFKEDIMKNLQMFIESEVEALPFSFGFSDSEIEAIGQIATSLGLDTVIPEHGSVKIKVLKTKSAE